MSIIDREVYFIATQLKTCANSIILDMFSASALLGIGSLSKDDKCDECKTQPTWPERWAPSTFEDMCDQADACENIKNWNGNCPLVVLGPVGCGKTTLIHLESRRRKAMLISNHDIENSATSGFGAVYVHVVFEESSVAEIVRLIKDRHIVIVETYDFTDPLRSAAIHCKYHTCEMQAPDVAEIAKWLASRNITAHFIVAGDIRATLLEAQLGSRIGGDRFVIDETENDYCANTELAMSCEQGALAMEWSLKGVLSTKKAVLRGVGEGVLPTHATGLLNMLEYIWYAPAKSLDKRGKQIQKSHKLRPEGKPRRVSTLK
jgi:hypothetical protein